MTMTILFVVHFLFLITIQLATCDVEQSTARRVANGFQEPAFLRHYWSDADESRRLKASTDDTTTAAAGEDKQKTKDANDDDYGSAVITDDAVANKTTIIPPEPEQPKSWPATVLVIFLLLSAVLLGKTAYTNFRKRSQYQNVPTTTLTV